MTTRRFARMLVRLYPPVWRGKYEDELIALLADGAVTPAVVVDVMRGALREWVREIAYPPGPPVDLKQERRRHFTAACARVLVGGAACLVLARLLRATAFTDSDSPLMYLLLFPMLLGMCRTCALGIRRGRLWYRAVISGVRMPEDAWVAMGIGRAEYWFWMVCFVVPGTLVATELFTGVTILRLYHLASFGYCLEMLHSNTTPALRRRAEIERLSLAQRQPRGAGATDTA